MSASGRQDDHAVVLGTARLVRQMEDPAEIEKTRKMTTPRQARTAEDRREIDPAMVGVAQDRPERLPYAAVGDRRRLVGTAPDEEQDRQGDDDRRKSEKDDGLSQPRWR